MSESIQERENGGELSRDERWTLVQRIVNSHHFSKAPQLRDILLYVSGRALDDAPATISEYEIACNALGRRPDFNANEDNIVRVQIRHLRKKLDEYFSEAGRDEPSVLTIPKGAYVPHFEPRAVAAAAPAVVDAASSPESAVPLLTPEKAVAADKPKTAWVLVVVLSVLVVALAVVSLTLWSQREALRRTVDGSVEPRWAADPLWSKMFAAGQQPSIVVADTCRVALQDILDVDIPLRDLVNGSFPESLIDSLPDRKLQAALRLIASRQYTSVADLTVAARLVELGQRYKDKPLIKYARHLDTRDFKTGNFVLIGSRRGIPWIQMFEPQLNFAFGQDRNTGKYQFKNKAPKPGERPFYRISEEETYGDLALVPNLSGTGYVLILSGIDMAATEAMGELVVSPDFSAALAKMLAAEPGAAYVEVLVQAKAMAGTARAPKIIAHRLLWPSKP